MLDAAGAGDSSAIPCSDLIPAETNNQSKLTLGFVQQTGHFNFDTLTSAVATSCIPSVVNRPNSRYFANVTANVLVDVLPRSTFGPRLKPSILYERLPPLSLSTTNLIVMVAWERAGAVNLECFRHSREASSG